MSKTKLLSLMIGVSLTIFSLGACSTAPDDGVKMAKEALVATKPYIKTDPKISIEYPANWKVENVKGNDLFKMRNVEGGASMSGMVQVAPLMTSESYAKAVQDIYSFRPRGKLVHKKYSEEEITIDGVKAVKIIHNQGGLNHSVKVLSVYFVKGDLAYTINCGSKEIWFAQFEPVFNKVIESIKLQ